MNFTKTTQILALMLVTSICWAQQRTEQVGSFSKLLVSPHIELILVKGSQEQVRWEYQNVAEDKLNAELDGNTLHLYLDKAKITPKQQRNKDIGWNYKESIYKNARVKAYVTFSQIKHLEMRGSETVTCEDPIASEDFRLKLYGDGDAYFASIRADDFKASLYGENTLDISSGHAREQTYKCYGENIVRASRFEGEQVSTTIFGESDLNLNAQGTMKVTSLGEGKVHYQGQAELNKGLILGETSISRSKSEFKYKN